MDDRLKGAKNEQDRADRALERRAAIGGDRDQPLDADDELRMQMFRDTFSKPALPALPPIPGYHVCWLTTTNVRDSVAQRQAIGYVPVTEEDVPGFGHLRNKDGEMAGFISVNEMVAFKIREELYRRFMMAVHHDAPLSEEEKLENALEQLQANAQAQKARIVAEEGSARIRQFARPPTFIS